MRWRSTWLPMAPSSTSGCSRRRPRNSANPRHIAGYHGRSALVGRPAVSCLYYGSMARLSLLAALTLVGTPLLAQEESASTGRCSAPDSIAVRGNQRVGDATIRADAQLTPGQPLNFRGVQRGIRALFATGQFTDVRLLCDVAATGRSTLVIEVAERPLLGALAITGVEKVPERTVREKVDLLVNRPLDPNQLARAIQRIDSVYENAGYYLAQVTPDTQTVDGKVNLTLRIDEGRRLAISGIRVNGNSVISDDEIVAEMKTKPEGFWWFRRGEFDEDEYASDLGERIAGLYAKRGFIDFQIIKDSLIVDRSAVRRCWTSRSTKASNTASDRSRSLATGASRATR